jgi:hypothetical protein
VLPVMSPKPQPAGLDPKRANHRLDIDMPQRNGDRQAATTIGPSSLGDVQIFEALLKPSTVAPALLVAPSNRMVLP